MDGSQGTSNSPAPFLTKTYDMVEDSSTNPIVSWSSGNNSFVVWNPLDFARDLLPKYFKHNNFSSFVRQLNTYGFRKADPDQWEFANEEFVRGQRHLLKNIHRRKPIHSHSLHHHGQGSLTEAERQVFEDEIDKLKRDKSMLILDLQTHVAQRHEIEKQMQSLEARLHSMEVHQQQMMTFLAEIVQRPGFLSTLMQQSEIHGKKRRLPKPDYFYEDRGMEETRIVAFQPSTIEKPDTMSMLDMEPYEKMESSLSSLENLFRSVSQASGEELYDTVLASLPSAVVLTEMHASSGDKDINMQPQSPKLRPPSPSLGEIHSSPELAETVNHADSPVIPPIEHIEIQSKISEIDVNSEPTGPEVSSSRDQPTKASASTVQIGVNDVFWQQFLTETPGLPGSSDTQEAESQRRDLDSRKSEGETTHRGSPFWWKNVDHLTEKMVHLTPAERT